MPVHPEDNHPAAPELLTRWQAPAPSTRELDLAFVPPQVFSLPSALNPMARKILGIDALLDVFSAIPPCTSALEFSQNALKAMGITLQTDPGLAEAVPSTGPLVIVANHPFGGVDGLALMAALLPLRPDLKVLINILLGIFPELRQACLPLDILSGTASSFAINSSSLRTASSLLQNGGAVAFFPSGTVSHWQRGKGIVDPDWQIAAARLAKRHKATVLPVYFHGRNSRLFYTLGLAHPLLRTLLLPRELAKKFGATIHMSHGRLIDPGAMQILQGPESITAYLRMRTYALADTTSGKAKQNTTADRPMEPVAELHKPELVAKALTELSQNALLVQEGDYAVYCMRGNQSPLLLEELGSLRESTFRLVGEGSGKSRDLDNYDNKYYHLLLWHIKDQRLVGAYRLGSVQEILADDGPSGLYTTTLFRMSPEFFRRYENALELGRAIVHPEYQREYQPLMMLWKGIARFVLRCEDVHCLFGPVSLSLDYTPTSLGTVVEYLQTQCGSSELSSMVKGKTAPDKFLRANKGINIPLPDTLNYNGLVALIKDIEGGRGIPILFKHYLKLGGKIAAFHIDHSFNTLDAFLLMDLAHSPQNMLERYMTPEGAAAFFRRWK